MPSGYTRHPVSGPKFPLYWDNAYETPWYCRGSRPGLQPLLLYSQSTSMVAISTVCRVYGWSLQGGVGRKPQVASFEASGKDLVADGWGGCRHERKPRTKQSPGLGGLWMPILMPTVPSTGWTCRRHCIAKPSTAHSRGGCS